MSHEIITKEAKLTKRSKKKASFLKIYIKTEEYKINIIPIPLWLAKGTISFILRLIKLSMNFSKKNFGNFTKKDVNEILSSIRPIMKEIKSYPPFSIIEVETKDTLVSIRTK